MENKVLVGADPEFFLRDKETGKFVSAYGMIEGTKENPLKVENGAVQVDGMALEFNIDPVDNAEDFVRNIKSVLSQLREMIDDRYEFVFEPIAHFDEEVLAAQPQEALILGCEPDFNAWEKGAVNPAPDAEGKNYRTAAGHIHIGWAEGMDINNEGHAEAGRMMVMALDYTMMFVTKLWDKGTLRPSLYGGLGAHRIKPYGVEYRVCSNVWLNDEKYMHLMFHLVQDVFKSLTSKHKHFKTIFTYSDDYKTHAKNVLLGHSNPSFLTRHLKDYSISNKTIKMVGYLVNVAGNQKLPKEIKNPAYPSPSLFVYDDKPPQPMYKLEEIEFGMEEQGERQRVWFADGV